jgi:predicted nucleic acid-binding protein
VGRGRFDISLSVPLVLEYEDVAKRLVGSAIQLTEADVDDVIDYLCSVALQHKVYFLWRPFLKDPKDDMVLELAVSAGCSFIVTYNRGDFKGAEQFQVEIVTPKGFLEKIGELL